jgi:hypothetical protein
MYRTHSLLLTYYLPGALAVGLVAATLWQPAIPWYVWCILVPFVTVLIVALLGKLALLQEERRLAPAAETGARASAETTEEDLLQALVRLRAGVPLAIQTRGATGEDTTDDAEVIPSTQELVQCLQSDPELLIAVVHLRTSLADERLRPHVLAALQVLARAAKKAL